MTEETARQRNDLEKALEKINSSVGFKDAHLELMADSRMDDFIKFLAEHYYPDDTLSISLGFQADDAVASDTRAFFKDNLSILLVDDITRDILACRGIVILKKEQPPFEFANKKLEKIIKFTTHKNSQMDVFKRYNVETAIGFVCLCTQNKHRRKGLATKIFEAALMFSKELDLNPVCIDGSGTSPYSQKIYEKFEFETLHRLRYDEYKIDGKMVFENTGKNKETRCYVKQL